MEPEARVLLLMAQPPCICFLLPPESCLLHLRFPTTAPSTVAFTGFLGLAQPCGMSLRQKWN